MSIPNATAQQICLFALRKLGVVNRQMPVQADDMKDALEALWFVLDSFAQQRLVIPCYQNVQGIVDEPANSFTIGSGCFFDSTPPIDIDSVVVNSGGTIYQVSPMAAAEVWTGLAEYAENRNYPRFYTYNRTYPAAKIDFDAMLLTGDSVTIYGAFPISTTFDVSAADVDVTSTNGFSVQLSLTEETAFPAGYQSMLMWNVAEYLMPEYPQDNAAVIQQIVKEAKSSRDRIKSVNNRGRNLQFTDTNRPRPWGAGCVSYPWL